MRTENGMPREAVVSQRAKRVVLAELSPVDGHIRTAHHEQ